MKLGVFFENIYYKKDGAYSTDQSFILFANSFQKYFSRIDYIGRVTRAATRSLYGIETGTSTVVELPFYENVYHLCRQYPSYIRKIRPVLEKFVMEHDVFFICIPHIPSWEILRLCRKYDKKVFVFVRQNFQKVIQARYRRPKRYVAQIVITALNFLTDRYCRQYPVLAMGQELYQRYVKVNPQTVLFANSKYTRKDIITEHNLKPLNWNTRINILYAGRLECNKGLQFLLEALAGITSFTFTLTIAGDGPYKNELDKISKKLNLDGRMQFTGNIPFGDDLFRLYEQSDIFILPSMSEGLPQVVLEAMAKGVLVLASRTGGIADIIEHGKNGFLFDAANRMALYSLLESLHTAKTDTVSLRSNALKTAEHYCQENQHRIFEKLFAQCYGPL